MTPLQAALVVIAVAAGLRLLGPGGVLPGVAAMLVCAVAGTTVPDIDQPLGIGHRSGLTHSVLPAAAALARRWAWPIAAGLAFGLGLHLAADMFPEAIRGYATVKLPGAGSIGGWSYLWLAANAAAGLALFGWVLARMAVPPWARFAALGAAGVLALWYLGRVDGGWWALACGAGLAFVAVRLGRAVRA